MWTSVFGDGPAQWLKKAVVKRREVVDDNAIFRLHSVFTPIVLLFCSGILTLEQLGIGTTTISCLHDKNDDDNFVKFINTFCWITKTYTVARDKNAVVGVHEVAPGVTQGKPEKLYAYYQWVVFVLFFQGILCYAPKYLWNCWEDGFLKQLVHGLNTRMENTNYRERNTQVVKYLTSHRKQFTIYMIRYWLCELLCLVNIGLQLLLMDKFLNGRFFRYGLDFMTYHRLDQDYRYDPMINLFPRVTKCDFRSYGPSGTLQLRDAMCILPLNIINEKTYIFVWFWFALLLVGLSLLVVYRVLLCCVPWARHRLLCSRDGGVSEYSVAVACRKGSIGDWWVMYMLSKNIDAMNFRDIIMGVAKED